MIPDWPSPGEDEPGIFYTSHEVDFALPHEEVVSRWITGAVETEGRTLHRLDFIFCPDDFLLEINRTHLGHDFYTDIITFPLNADPLLAEIYISLDRVKENASALGIRFEDELHRVMIHGVLHLCGYDDHDDEDIQEMREKEEWHLKRLNV